MFGVFVMGIAIQTILAVAKRDENKLRVPYVVVKSAFDPHKRYEEIKMRNFQASSRLEGINIDCDQSVSLDNVLEKYRK